MRVTLFANVSVVANPYLSLLQAAVQPHCAGPVRHELRLTPAWALAHGRPGQIAHLHWIEGQVRPPVWFGAGAAGLKRVVYKLGHNRVAHPARMAGALMQLAVALALAQARGARIVYTVHNLTPHHRRQPYQTGLIAGANRLIFARADAVHVHSQSTADEIGRRFGRSRNVFCVPLGNYIGQYPNALTRAEARARLGLPADAFVGLFFGQIAPYKGLERLLEAVQALDDPELRLVIAGKAVLPEYAARIAAQAQRPGILYRPGFVPEDEVQVFCNAADVMTLPFEKITTSSSLMLAYSFGLPVVAPALPYLKEFVTPEVGVLYPPEAPGALADALRQARRTAWSRSAVLAYARRFDWPVVGAQMAEVYRASLGQGSGPA